MKSRYRQLLVLIAVHRLRFVVAMLCMIVMAAASAASAYLIKPVLDDVFINRDAHMLRVIPVVVVLIYLLRGMAMYGQEYLMNYVGEAIILELRRKLYNRIQDLSLAFFQRERTGVLMSRITNDVNVVKIMVSAAVAGAFRDIFTIVFLTAVIFYQDWEMAVYAILILPIAFFPVVHIGRFVRRLSTGRQEAMADISAFLHETFAGNKIIKAFNMQSHEKGRFAHKVKALFNLEMKAVRARSLSSPVMESLAGVGIAFIIWYGGYRVVNGTSTTGTFFSFMAAVIMLYDPVKKLSKVNNAVQEGLAATDRIFDIIESQSDIRECASPRPLSNGPHRVTFEDVGFTYDRRPVLEHIDLDVRSGEILAIVGTSGGGKTSLVNLIPRFYDVSQGRVLIDGLDIREVALPALRGQIALVTQEPILFNSTIGENIAYGNPAATPAEIQAAAKAAYAHDFIRRFARQYDTTIGELGGRLSGGEKQRICIARALLKNAPILILDEATSSLDTESEMWVQKALENLMKGRTTFVIAHRLSTIQYAHRIIVIANGGIAEEGQHEALIAKAGEYCKLYQMQFNQNRSNHPRPVIAE